MILYKRFMNYINQLISIIPYLPIHMKKNKSICIWRKAQSSSYGYKIISGERKFKKMFGKLQLMIQLQLNTISDF